MRVCATMAAQAHAGLEAKLQSAHDKLLAALNARFAELRECSRAILAALGAALR